MSARGAGRAAGGAQPGIRRAGRGGRRHRGGARRRCRGRRDRVIPLRRLPARAAACSSPTSSTSARACPKSVLPQAYSLVDDADALLVAGSSLTVFSGLPVRPARRGAAACPSRSSTAAPPAATTWRPSRSTAAARSCWRCSPTSSPRDFGTALERCTGMLRMPWMKLPAT